MLSNFYRKIGFSYTKNGIRSICGKKASRRMEKTTYKTS